MAEKKRKRANERAARKEVAEQFALWIDQPADWELKVRHLRITGWAVAKHGGPVTEIRAKLGPRVFSGAFDRERPDVAAYLQMPDAPRSCGFTLGEWARFWGNHSRQPAGFQMLQNLPDAAQARVAAGFELLARKPARA